MANRFWVGGTGTWDNSTTTHWSATSGGAGGASVPSGDAVTFDASSGGGTVTVAATINGTNTIASLTCGAFTGTLDFSVNNPSISMQFFSITGAGVRTINLGSGTFTLTNQFSVNLWDAGTVTNLTFNCGTSTLVLVPVAAAGTWGFSGGGLTYNNVTITNTAACPGNSVINGSNTFNVLTLNANVVMSFAGTSTQTITSLVINSGASPGTAILASPGGSVGTISIASGTFAFSWIAIRNITFTGGATFSATNSFDLKNNSGITITAPSGGGGGRMIGG